MTLDMVRKALKGLIDSEIDFAFLHREEEWASSVPPSGDIDIIVDRPPLRAIEEAWEAWHESGLLCIAIWCYDVSSAAIFLTGFGWPTVIHLDLLYDPEGLGRYGLRTGPMLECKELGKSWPTVSRTDSLIYQLAKRMVKRQQSLAETLSRYVYSQEQAEGRRVELAGRGVLAVGQCSALGRFCRMRLELIRQVRRVGRVWKRSLYPVGTWIHIEARPYKSVGQDALKELAPLLPKGAALHERERLWLPFRMRAALGRLAPRFVITVGRLMGGYPRPDIFFEAFPYGSGWPGLQKVLIVVDAQQRRQLALTKGLPNGHLGRQRPRRDPVGRE